MDNRNEDAMMRALRAIIHTEISDRIDQINEAKEFKIEDYRDDIETMISEYINYNVSITLEA
jgi:ACT domain-containing protein